MNKLEIVEKHYHYNGNCAPFVVAIVDDPKSNDTKLVIMFDEEDFTAVLSLDTLIESEEVSVEENGHSADKYERALRSHLWNIEKEDDDLFGDEEESESY